MRKYSMYYVVMVSTIIACILVATLASRQDLVPVAIFFSCVAVVLVMLWSGIPDNEKYKPMTDKDAHDWIDKCASEDKN